MKNNVIITSDETFVTPVAVQNAIRAELSTKDIKEVVVKIDTEDSMNNYDVYEKGGKGLWIASYWENGVKIC